MRVRLTAKIHCARVSAVYRGQPSCSFCPN